MMKLLVWISDSPKWLMENDNSSFFFLTKVMLIIQSDSKSS